MIVQQQPEHLGCCLLSVVLIPLNNTLLMIDGFRLIACCPWSCCSLVEKIVDLDFDLWLGKIQVARLAVPPESCAPSYTLVT
jgi:hypothetical protein